jgi:TetR/AcrR family transcriptional regulator, transcriptional repressor for nem operon
MRVTKEQAAENRGRIIDVASMLFRRKGFDGIGVADLMKSAGLTHGGFYGHFASKDDLAAKAYSHAIAATADRWSALADDRPADALRAIAASYLSARHRDNPGAGCPMVALGSDVARGDSSLRRAFTEGLRPLIDVLTQIAPGRSKASQREKALATMAGLVGAVILARAVDDPALSEEILGAAATAFGGKSPPED